MPVDLECKSSIFYYTDDDVHKVLANYGKELKDLEDDMKSVKYWFKIQPHIPVAPSDKLIVFYLLMNKFSIEKTKTRLEMNYSIRSVMPEYYCYNPLHQKMRESHKYLKFMVVPNLTKDLRRIVLFKYESEPFLDISLMISRMIMGLELLAMYDFNIGDEYISDCSNVNLSLITKIKLTDIKKFVALLNKVYTNRFFVIHTVNLPPAAEALFNVFKFCLKPKLRDRLLLHNSTEALKQYYSLDILPKDYGGNAKSIDESASDFQSFFESHDEYFSKWMKIRVNEKLRPEPLVNDEILGFHGNFKKLDVD
ncbi:PREDICTED: uncharacterized protein LOC108557017 [Nicrophorus vespilloides]|uniref:Uncharacterized protein LOC108557017 n=1 Tax=Nicrophorus vespilloides TaxID=110193 RepID=A0ABM1M2T3_NICVS|nr:PREDICTED: uncharacterized protein LOC108557017 [Nicrophorus vespilloides]